MSVVRINWRKCEEVDWLYRALMNVVRLLVDDRPADELRAALDYVAEIERGAGPSLIDETVKGIEADSDSQAELWEDTAEP